MAEIWCSTLKERGLLRAAMMGLTGVEVSAFIPKVYSRVNALALRNYYKLIKHFETRNTYLMTKVIHPTKAQLIRSTVEILESKLPNEIAVDEILEKSGISKGSLYHHFEDLTELIEAAQVHRYASWVDRSIEMIISLISASKSREDLLVGLKKVTRLTQDPQFISTRYARARAIASAEHSPRFRKALSQEQNRLTDALIDLIEEARNKGYYAKDFDARAGAVLVQAYTLGKMVDDFVEEPMDPEEWYKLIDKVVDRVFLSDQ